MPTLVTCARISGIAGRTGNECAHAGIDHAEIPAPRGRRDRPARSTGRAATALVMLLGACAASALAAEPFSFSKDAAKERADAERQASAVAQLVSVPCQQRLKDRKILLLLAERTETGLDASQERYGPHIRVLESRLRALGLRPYTQEQIRAQIAQAEIEAYFRNDPDAAIAASRRLAADLVLRGDILTLASVNPVLGINEVAVSVSLALSDARTGRLLSEVAARSEAFSGTDTLGTALDLVRREADPLVARIYNDLCQNANAGGT